MVSKSYIKRPNVESEYTPEQLQELKKCSEDPVYFIKNYVKILHPTRGKVPFALYDFQEEMLMGIHENRDTVILCARQNGKTITISMYLLWVATFMPEQEILIASKNNRHAIQIMDRIKYAYEELPMWLKAGCKFYNRHTIAFDNGSTINSEPTTEKTGRGGSISKLYLDELAFINPRVQTEMWASLAPTLSTGGGFIISSTPNGDTDLFASLWRGANSGINGFVPLFFAWDRHPERGEEYKKDMLGKLGPVKFRQEVLCEFLSSDSMLINSVKLAQLTSTPPLFLDMGVKFWSDKIGGKDKHYLVGADIATGGGADSSVIEIFEFPSLVQVGEFRSNEINIPFLYDKIKWVINRLSEPDANKNRASVSWTFERNAVGEAIASLMTVDENPPEFGEHLSDDPQKLGMMTTGKNKIVSCLELKTLIEKIANGLTIKSDQLLFELKNFVASGGSYAAKVGASDDAISATLLIIRLLKLLAQYDEQAFNKMYNYNATEHESVVPPSADDEPFPFAIM